MSKNIIIISDNSATRRTRDSQEEKSSLKYLKKLDRTRAPTNSSASSSSKAFSVHNSETGFKRVEPVWAENRQSWAYLQSLKRQYPDCYLTNEKEQVNSRVGWMIGRDRKTSDIL